MLLQIYFVGPDQVAVVLRLKPVLIAPSSWDAPFWFTWSLLPLPHLKLQPLTFVYTHNQISTIESASWQPALEDKYFLPSASSPCLFHLHTHFCQLTRNQAGAAHHYQRQPSPITRQVPLALCPSRSRSQRQPSPFTLDKTLSQPKNRGINDHHMSLHPTGRVLVSVLCCPAHALRPRAVCCIIVLSGRCLCCE